MNSWIRVNTDHLTVNINSLALNVIYTLTHREQGDNQRIVHDLTAELRRVVKKHSEAGLLPMECSYLNKSAFIAAAPHQVMGCVVYSVVECSVVCSYLNKSAFIAVGCVV